MNLITKFRTHFSLKKEQADQKTVVKVSNFSAQGLVVLNLYAVNV